MHPFNQSFNAWIDSEEGRNCMHTQSLKSDETFAQYLRNRLEAAYKAGWNGAVDHVHSKALSHADFQRMATRV